MLIGPAWVKAIAVTNLGIGLRVREQRFALRMDWGTDRKLKLRQKRH